MPHLLALHFVAKNQIAMHLVAHLIEAMVKILASPFTFSINSLYTIRFALGFDI